MSVWNKTLMYEIDMYFNDFLKQLNLNDKKISTLMVKICKQRYDDVMWRHSYFVKKSQTQCQTDSLRLKLKVVFCTSNGSGTTWNPGFGFFTRNPGIGFFTQNLRLEKHLLLNKDFHYLFFAKIWLDLLKIFWMGSVLKILLQYIAKIWP